MKQNFTLPKQETKLLCCGANEGQRLILLLRPRPPEVGHLSIPVCVHQGLRRWRPTPTPAHSCGPPMGPASIRHRDLCILLTLENDNVWEDFQVRLQTDKDPSVLEAPPTNYPVWCQLIVKIFLILWLGVLKVLIPQSRVKRCYCLINKNK